jgi:hypothetical protein
LTIHRPERPLYSSPGQTKCRPGLENGRYNRPRDKVHKRGNLLSDEGDDLLFHGNDVMQFRPKGIFALYIESPRTVFLLHPLPRVAFRFVPPETLPCLSRLFREAIVFWPFRPEKYSAIDLCIKSSYK